jgi:hypothetical protein
VSSEYKYPFYSSRLQQANTPKETFSSLGQLAACRSHKRNESDRAGEVTSSAGVLRMIESVRTPPAKRAVRANKRAALEKTVLIKACNKSEAAKIAEAQNPGYTAIRDAIGRGLN